MTRNSLLESLPTEILQYISIRVLKASEAEIEHRDGSLRYLLNPGLLQTCRTILNAGIGDWESNRLVRVTYRGAPCYQPKVFMPIVGDNTYRTLEKAKRESFVADLQLNHTSQMADSRELTESVCVVTMNAVTTWLAILGCMQHTDKACLFMRLVGETPKLSIGLSFNDEASGKELRKAFNLMLVDQTDLHLDIAEKNGTVRDWLCSRPRQSQLYPMALANRIYGAWLSARLRHTGVFAEEERIGTKLEYCQLLCKQLLGHHFCGRLPSQDGSDLATSHKVFLAERVCVELLEWAHRFQYLGGAKETPSSLYWFKSYLSEDLHDRGLRATCTIDHCPCLLWTVLGWPGVQTLKRADAERAGIAFQSWLEVNRWSIALHCMQGLDEEYPNPVATGKRQLLELRTQIRDDELTDGFIKDLNAFTTTATSSDYRRDLMDRIDCEKARRRYRYKPVTFWESLGLFAEQRERSERVLSMRLANYARDGRPIRESDAIPLQPLHDY